MKTFTLDVKVVFEDIDMLKTVYHVNYFKYLDRARNSALNDGGVGFNTLSKKNIGIFVFEANSRFIKPAFYDEDLIVYTRVPKISGSVIEIEHVICNSPHEDLSEPFLKFKNVIHKGIAKAVLIDAENQRPLIEVPHFVQEALL